jgi:hypothetical protein
VLRRTLPAPLLALLAASGGRYELSPRDFVVGKAPAIGAGESTS